MTEKILTISIASYNAEKDLPKCLDSFVDSNVLDKLDIIVINDGSSDNTSKIAHNYADKHSSIRVIDKLNGGHGSTINCGIVSAKGKYFRIVDSDDWIDPNELEKLVKYLEKSNVDVVFTPYQTVDVLDKAVIETIDNFHCCVDFAEEKNISVISENTLLAMHAMTFKTSCIKEVGPIIDEHCFYVDSEYFIYPLVFARSFVFLNYNVYKYSIGSLKQSVAINSMIKRRDEHLKVVKSVIQYYKNNEDRVEKSVKNLIYRNLKKLIAFQIYLYIISNSNEAKNELIDFVRYLETEKFSPLSCLDSIKNKFGFMILKLTKFTAYTLLSTFFIHNKKKR